MFNITPRLNFIRTLGSTVMSGIILFLSVPAATYAADTIIDIPGPGTSFSNPPGWHVKTMASAYKGQTLRTFNKSAWSTFKFGSLASGKYDVYMHWPISSGTPPDNAAPVVIKHSSGTQTVTVNQRQNGGRWNRLGSWTLNNTAYLTLTNRGNGPIYSDAVKLVPSVASTPPTPPPPPPPHASDIIIDNRGPGMSSSNPPGWHVKTMPSAYKGDTLRTFNKGAWSTFKFGSLASGTYDVYMHWPDATGLTPPDNAAPVIIKHSSGTQIVTINQQQNGGKWNRLGRWTLNNTAYLTLTNRGNVNIYSDAVKLVPSLVTPPQDPTLSFTANPVQVGKGGTATLSWASQHATSCTASAGWSGIKGTSGHQSITITSSQTYNLTCAGTTKTVSATVKVAVISTPPPPPPVQPIVVGLNVNQFLGGSFDTAGQAFTQELGTHSIRVSYKHGDHDFAVNWAAQRGIGVLFFLGYSQGCNPTTPEGRQCYANRSANLAQTYGDKVQYYEVWNEWNGGLGLGGGWPACFPTCKDAVMYTDLLCRTYKAIKAVRPSAKVVGGVTAGTHTDFIRRMLDAGAGNCMDVVSVHPYVYHIGTSEFRVPSVDSPASVGADKFIEAITATHNLVKQKTGKAMPVIVTEEGRHTGNSAASEQLTANYLTELYNRAESVPFLDGIWWFGLEDGAASVGTTGLVRSNNTKKPAFAAFQAGANR